MLVIASTNAELAIGEHDIPGTLSGGRPQAHLNTRFSAVAVITRDAADTPAGRSAGNGQAYRLQIFHNPFAAIPLKPEFASPYDWQWAAVDSGRKYQQIGPNRVLARPPRC